MYRITLLRMQGDGTAGAPDKIGRVGTDNQCGFG